jgi:protein TonB
MKRENEKFDRFLTMSAVLHGALFAVVLFSSSLFPMQGGAWGSETATGDGIGVTIVGSVSGITLPSPPVVRPEAAANESKGFYNTETAAPPPPPEKAVPIPETTAPVRVTPPPRPARTAPPQPSADEAPPPPSNEVPFGQGGKPALSYGQFPTGAGSAGIGFGDGTFGDRYAWYVQAITRRISQNWLQSMVDSRLRVAPRVYLTFQIGRNGAITSIETMQSSGFPALDRSALRAILASNPLPALPNDYRGSSVTVSFYFEYVR